MIENITTNITEMTIENKINIKTEIINKNLSKKMISTIKKIKLKKKMKK